MHKDGKWGWLNSNRNETANGIWEEQLMIKYIFRFQVIGENRKPVKMIARNVSQI